MLRKLWNAIFLWGSQDSPVLQARQTRRLLFTIHGIRTRGIWQEALALELKGRDWTHCPFKYGYFSLPQFLNKRSREKISETFRDWYFKRCAEFEPDEKMRRSRR